MSAQSEPSPPRPAGRRSPRAGRLGSRRPHPAARARRVTLAVSGVAFTGLAGVMAANPIHTAAAVTATPSATSDGTSSTVSSSSNASTSSAPSSSSSVSATAAPSSSSRTVTSSHGS